MLLEKKIPLLKWFELLLLMFVFLQQDFCILI